MLALASIQRSTTFVFLNRTVDATLSGALLAITSDRSKLSDHYERDSPILSEASVERIVAGARCLDEMDAEGLAELQIAAFVSFRLGQLVLHRWLVP